MHSSVSAAALEMAESQSSLYMAYLRLNRKMVWRYISPKGGHKDVPMQPAEVISAMMNHGD
jgi:hypothetical protein